MGRKTYSKSPFCVPNRLRHTLSTGNTLLVYQMDKDTPSIPDSRQPTLMESTVTRLADPSQDIRRCLNILQRHQEEDDLLDTLADGVQGFADLIADGVLGKAERVRDLTVLHPVAAAHQEYSPSFGRKAVDG